MTQSELQKRLEQSTLEHISEPGRSSFIDADGVIHTGLADARIVAELLEKPAGMCSGTTLAHFTVYFSWNSVDHTIEHIELGLSDGERGIVACAHNFRVMVWSVLHALLHGIVPNEVARVYPLSLMTQAVDFGEVTTWKGYLGMQLASLSQPDPSTVHKTFEVLLQDHVANAGASAATYGKGLHWVYLFTSQQPDGSSHTECKIDNSDWLDAAGDLSRFRWVSRSQFQMLKAFFVLFPAEGDNPEMRQHLENLARDVERQSRWKLPWQRKR